MNWWQTIEDYLQTTLGIHPALRPLPDSDKNRIPLLLRTRYDIVSAKVLGRNLVLIRDRSKDGVAPPTEYVAHLTMLHEQFSPDVALVLPILTAYTRTRLVQAGVPFIVPGRQIFLPMLATDLHERTPRFRQLNVGTITLATQVVLLRHILGYEMSGHPLRALASNLGYSAMTLTNVAEELVAHEFCWIVAKGRSRMLEFNGTKRELWDRSLPLLRSPVRGARWVRLPNVRMARDWKLAGTSALEHLTMLQGDALPTYAITNRALAHLFAEDGVVEVPDAEGATAKIETWGYDPRLLTTGPTVDLLSLFLSMRNTSDERVAKALRQMLEDGSW